MLVLAVNSVCCYSYTTGYTQRAGIVYDALFFRGLLHGREVGLRHHMIW